MIEENLSHIRHRIRAACESSHRPLSHVTLLAVSKKQSVHSIKRALAAGVHAFGENYVQEGISKIHDLEYCRDQLEWHFIGHIQSNKTREVATYFDWVHTIERKKIAQRLSEQRASSLPPLQVCIQVNISAENSKSGVRPDEVFNLAKYIMSLPRLQLRGLMSIPQLSSEPEDLSACHRTLRVLLKELRSTLNITDSYILDTLSMGLSADLELAIEEGATLVRVGSALFGDRIG